MASLLNMSGRALVKMPYDAEIEYLESSGTQYIELPRGIDSSTDMRVDFLFGANNNNDRFLFGSSDGWMVNVFMLGAASQTKNYTFRYYNIREAVNRSYAPYGSRNLFVKNGQYISLGSYSVTCPSYSKTIQKTFIFCGTSNGSDPMSNQNNKYMRIYSFYMSDSIYQVDLIPVRVGTTGYLYDKVSGQCFGNAGTGSFILGNDI